MIKQILPMFLSFLFLFPMAYGQDANMTRKEKKETRKAQEQADREKNYGIVLKLLEERNFVIEVRDFVDRYGQTVPVSPTTNFVAVSDSLATLQLAFPGSIGGYNGLGGITIDGNVTDIEVLKKDPRKGITFQISVFGNGFASADMFVDVDLTNGRANIRYTGQRGERFTLRGTFLAYDASRVYKGTTLF